MFGRAKKEITDPMFWIHYAIIVFGAMIVYLYSTQILSLIGAPSGFMFNIMKFVLVFATIALIDMVEHGLWLGKYTAKDYKNVLFWAHLVILTMAFGLTMMWQSTLLGWLKINSDIVYLLARFVLVYTVFAIVDMTVENLFDL